MRFYDRKGDYYRYLAEFLVGNERKEMADNALMAYNEAQNIATNHLPTTHPIRLGLVFFYFNLYIFLRVLRLDCFIVFLAHLNYSD